MSDFGKFLTFQDGEMSYPYVICTWCGLLAAGVIITVLLNKLCEVVL